jgi:hypothetical protein
MKISILETQAWMIHWCNVECTMHTRKNTKKIKIQKVKFEKLSSMWSGELLRIEHHQMLVFKS